ncbi:flavin reductase family protein [Chitinispirillales bacterium ANBcel5]|uniref:flavin reductase family protein n=1 Tax=Cellulosispirillum alkaliphilum TaxID=3039283 RepID=UPI002A52E717|nr:flavin reductase family protein [Chitinispirillales bacterium ANBcel5]
MQQVDYMAIADEAMSQIRKGAFLTVQAGDDLNVMTIGWASLGHIWGRPIMTILVRKSRHTFKIIEKTDEFTVSVPSVDMSEQLAFCGSESGRDHDKFKKCSMEIFPGKKVRTPVINVPGTHFECKIVYKSPMDPGNLVESYKHLYPQKDYHTIYYGEIVNSFAMIDEV